MVVQDLNLGEVKTKKAAEIFERLVGQYALIVEGENRELTLSVRNIPRLKYLPLEGLNVFDILKYPNLVVTESMVRRIEGVLAK